MSDFYEIKRTLCLEYRTSNPLPLYTFYISAKQCQIFMKLSVNSTTSNCKKIKFQ